MHNLFPWYLKKIFFVGIVFLQFQLLYSQQTKPEKSGTPVFPGSYDPEGIIFGKQYWIYPTYSAPYNEQVFLDAFSSSDLVHWTKHSTILDTARVKWAKRAMWAPSIVEKSGKYYLFFGAENDIQSDKENGGIGVAVADNPGGPFTDYLKKPLVDKFHNGAQPIDQFVFKDKDQYYLIYGGWRHCNIAKLKDDFTGFVPFDDGTIFRKLPLKTTLKGLLCLEKRAEIFYVVGRWLDRT